MNSETTKTNQKKFIKINGNNNLPKVQKNISNNTNEEIITTTKNKRIFISETNSNNISPTSKTIKPKNITYYDMSPSSKYYQVVTHSPSSNYKIIQAKEINNNLLHNHRNNINNDYNIESNNNIIYNNTEYNNNDFYICKNNYKEKTIDNCINNKNQIINVFDSSTYDVKKTKRIVKYTHNSPNRNSKIFVKSILCSPIKVTYSKIDNPFKEQSYREFKEEYEETEIVIRNKMSKIWENESQCVTECNLSFICDGKNDKNYLIEEYEEKIQELNSTIFTLKKNQNDLLKQIEELQYISNNNNNNPINENKKFFDNLDLESFHLNIIHDKKKSWNEILKRHNVNKINIFPKKRNIKPINVIEYGTYLEILSLNDQQKTTKGILSFEYGDEIFIPGNNQNKIKKNKIERLKGFNIFKKQKYKAKNKIEHLNDIKIFPKDNLKLKSKPKNSNIIEAANNIYIPRKQKELFTWDTFYGQELYILPKKKKKIYNIEFLDDLEILKVPKPDNEIEFNEPIEIIPEPKAPLEINFLDEFYIPESNKKLKASPKTNKIVYPDKIRLLGKNKGKNIVQKVSLVEIYPYSKPKIIEYEENESVFIPGLIKPENTIYFNDTLEIIPEKILEEYLCEPRDNINLDAFDKPQNEEEKIDNFEIFRKEKPENIIEQNDYISIESTPKNIFLDIVFGEEIYIENLIKPENEIQAFQGFDILGKEKPLNEIHFGDEIQILSEPSPKLNLTLEEIDLFTINQLEKPKNKLQRVNEVKILKNIKNKINKIFKSCSLSIIPQPKPKNYIQKTSNINLFGKTKENIYEIAFTDEMIIDNIEKPINKIQRIEEVKIIKKPKITIKNIKIKSSEFSILKKIKPKQKNKIQKNDSIKIYPEPKQNLKNTNLEIYFGDELYIENNFKQNKPNNKIEKLKGFNILKYKKPLNKIEIQIGDEIEILPKEKIINNKPQRTCLFEIIKKNKKKRILNKCQKIENFIIKPKQNKLKNMNMIKKNKEENIIENTSNYQIISVSIRELYQQRLQGFVIYKKDKEPNEIEKNYSFIIEKEYDALLARPIWDNLFIQKEDFIIMPSINNYNINMNNRSKLTNEVQDDFLIEANSQNSKYKENYINDSFTNINSKDLSVDICRKCGGQKVYENNYSYRYRNNINIMKSKNGNNSYKQINNISSNNNEGNVIKSKLYKTLLALPQNEIDYINNIEICPENRNDRILFSDDEYIKEKKNLNRKKYKYKNNYDNKSYAINKNSIQNMNNLNFTNAEICNYSQVSEENNLNQNLNSNYRINKKFITNTMLRKKNYRYDNNTSNDISNPNNNIYQSGYSRFTYYRNCANSGQSKSQLKTMVINHNRKRKLFRFEEGKGIKVIYQ